MTEPKSPREIADIADEAATSIICSAIDHGYEIHGRKFVKQIAASIIQQALLSYAAERERLIEVAEGALAMRSGELQIAERLLAEADAVIDAFTDELFKTDAEVAGVNGTHVSQALARHRLRSRPATEGKAPDAPR